jgi:hypothetical protein
MGLIVLENGYASFLKITPKRRIMPHNAGARLFGKIMQKRVLLAEHARS